ncbi:uncharacterized protein LOC144140976 isoform X2 [Haemaphysalis longicornis]
MAFKKGTPQAQKGKAKGPVAGKKTSPQKNPSLDDLEDDDLDEEDDDDLDFNDDSDLSGADEDLDDEELDDEELDDEEDDDEDEEGSEDEEAPAGTARGQQGTPAKAAVNGKRKADDQLGPSSSKRVCLQVQVEVDFEPDSPHVSQIQVNVFSELARPRVPLLRVNVVFESAPRHVPPLRVRMNLGPAPPHVPQQHIPADHVIDYEARDMCDVKLSDFAAGVTVEDVKNLCKDSVEVRSKQFQKKLSCAFVRYGDKDKATAAVQALKGAKLKGQPFTVQYCGTRWTDPATRPQQLSNVLDVRGLPKPLQDKKKLAALYPTGQVVKVFRDGYAQVRFPSSDALIKAVKAPSGRTVGNTQLRLAIALNFKDKEPKRRAAKKPPPSTQRGAVQKRGRARKSASGRSPGQRGTPGPKGSPKTPQQQKGKSPGQKGSPQSSAKKASPKTPGNQKGPKTPGNQKGPKTPGQAKGGAATPKSTNKGTPFQKRTPKGTPGKA